MRTATAEPMGLKEGDIVYVTKGAFGNFSGTVEAVNLQMDLVRVAIPIFGHWTSVDLDFDEVEKLS